MNVLVKTIIGPALLAGVTHAGVFLTPGGVAALPTDIPLATAPVAVHVSPFAAGTISGTITSTAHVGEPGNPHGGVTFSYAITTALAAIDTVNRVTVSNYAGWLTDVANETSLSLWNFYLGTRDPSGDVMGGMVQAPPGVTTSRFLVYTDAPAWAIHPGAVINSTAAPITALAPIPEPHQYALLAGLGLFGFAAWRRFRA